MSVLSWLSMRACSDPYLEISSAAANVVSCGDKI